MAQHGIGTVQTSSKGIGTSALPKLSNSANLLTGAIARAAAGFAMMPITVIKVRYESSLYSYRSLYGASRDILLREGPRGFFAGFGATAVRDAPYAGLYVLFYEAGKRRLGSALVRFKNAETTGLDLMNSGSAAGINFVSGVVAAGTATAITNPFDAIKTRLQLMPARYGNMVRAGRIMLREEGVRSLFDGLALRMARKAMSSALAWTVYEEIIRRAEIRWVEEKKVL
jgi:solute carrier family 25 protein 38